MELLQCLKISVHLYSYRYPFLPNIAFLMFLPKKSILARTTAIAQWEEFDMELFLTRIQWDQQNTSCCSILVKTYSSFCLHEFTINTAENKRELFYEFCIIYQFSVGIEVSYLNILIDPSSYLFRPRFHFLFWCNIFYI